MTMHQRGDFLTKEAPPTDAHAAAVILEPLTKQLGDIASALETSKKDAETHYKELTTHYSGVKADTDELKAAVQKHTEAYGDLILKVQTQEQALDFCKKQLDMPFLKGGKELDENDRKAGIAIQERAFLFKGGHPDEFVPDLDNLIDMKAYRSAVRKMMKVGIENKRKVIANLNEIERKAFESSSLDSAIFVPEMLGLSIDCNLTCASMTDLYGQVTVSKSTFMYPQVLDYGAIGKYDCDAKCDAEYGPEGNIVYKAGNVSDFRGVFCFQRKVLAEANYDLLAFMYMAARRSQELNRNRALMVGDGINEPVGWLTADCFTKVKTAAATFNHVDFRLFYASSPVEYGPVTAVMHQNVFAYLAALTDTNGRFIFGDGLMTYSPNDVRENIRISNCLPDPTYGLTKGSTGAPFVTGDFLVAVGSWASAYYVVNKRPLWIEQWEGQSTAWCVKYVFGAEDGGFTACCPAARILTVGP
jgi:HK97 family phage major capsid protein